MSILPTFIQYFTEVPSKVKERMREREERERENPKESTNYQLEIIGEFSKVVRYKGNVQKSIVFLCICNEQLETEI